MGASKDLQHLQSWLSTGIACEIMRVEQEMLSVVVDNFRPFRCLELACSPIIERERVREKVNFTPVKQVALSHQVVGDVRCLPFSSEYFDLVVCVHVHETVQQIEQMITELSRVLAPDGLLVFLCYNPAGWWYLNQIVGMSSWWRYPLSTQQLQRKCKDAALTHIYTEFGGGQHLCNNKDIWPYLSSFFCSQNTASVNQFVPAYMAEQVSSELSILYKSVLRKRVITPLMRMTSAQASLVRAGVV